MDINPTYKEERTCICPVCGGDGKIYFEWDGIVEAEKCDCCDGLGYLEIDSQDEIDWQAELRNDN